MNVSDVLVGMGYTLGTSYWEHDLILLLFCQLLNFCIIPVFGADWQPVTEPD